MRILLTLALFSASALSSTYAAAQTAPVNQLSLQADIETVYTLPDGRETRSKGRLYRSRSGQVREESPLGAVITDVAAGTITILIAETKEARVIMIPPDQRMRPGRPNGPRPEVFERTTIAGRRISKSRIQGPQGQRVEFWTAEDLGVVTWTKTEAAGLTTIRELRNLSTEEPSPAMFTIPGEYTIIEQEAKPGNDPRGMPPRRRGPGLQ